MTEKEKRRLAVGRLSDLKDQAIVMSLETMDCEDKLALYDAIFELFDQGELDNQFESYVFDGMSEDDRVKLIRLVSDHRGLVFYKGQSEYWLDSLEGYAVSDNEIITYSIFDNYDYLLDLGKRGGNRMLQQLEAFQDSGYVNSSVVEYLRRSNVNDELLASILLDMAREDSLYNIFTNEQKCVLLGNPYGNLFTYTEDGVVVRSPIDIAIDLYKETYNKDITIDQNNGVDVVRGLREFLLTADIDRSVSERSDDYVLNMYRTDASKDVKEVTFDTKHDYLRTYMSEFAPDYGEDDYKKTL